MGPELRISRGALLDDIAAVRARIAPSTLMLVMKDDAYGHGLEWTTGTAAGAGVDWFGAYDVASALRIRRVLGDRDARVFAWATSTAGEVDDALAAGIDLGVGSEEYLQLILTVAARRGTSARVHLKIDTGLHRNGIRPEAWPAFAETVAAGVRDGLLRVAGLWSHLAEASDDEDDAAQAEFRSALDVLRAAGVEPEQQHLTASAASWWRPELRGTLSRIGAFCYGIRSADGPDLDGIRPVASLVARVVALDGDRAIIGIGSFDGLPSTLAGASVGTPAGARGLLRIDETTAVIDGWQGAAIGDEVHVFGPGDQGEDSATTLAERIGTVGEEVITRLTARVGRVIEA